MAHGKKEGKITNFINFNFQDSPSLKDIESAYDTYLPFFYFFYLKVIVVVTNNIHVNQNGVNNCREIHAFYIFYPPEHQTYSALRTKTYFIMAYELCLSPFNP